MGNITWLSRDEWGANPLVVTRGVWAPHAQFIGLVVHHTVVGYWGDPAAYMRRLQTSRPDLGLEVPYSFIVMPGATDQDAIIGVGRGWERTGAHTEGYNSTRYGVAFAGDFTDVAPTPGMFAAVREIGAHLADPIGCVATLGHRQTYATACPGNATYPLMDQLQPPFSVPLQVQSIQPTEPPDMQLDEKTTNGWTVNDTLNWSVENTNKIITTLASLAAVVADLATHANAPSAQAAVDTAAIAKQTADELAARLRN